MIPPKLDKRIAELFPMPEVPPSVHSYDKEYFESYTKAFYSQDGAKAIAKELLTDMRELVNALAMAKAEIKAAVNPREPYDMSIGKACLEETNEALKKHKEKYGGDS